MYITTPILQRRTELLSRGFLSDFESQIRIEKHPVRRASLGRLVCLRVADAVRRERKPATNPRLAADLPKPRTAVRLILAACFFKYVALEKDLLWEVKVECRQLDESVDRREPLLPSRQCEQRSEIRLEAVPVVFNGKRSLIFPPFEERFVQVFEVLEGAVDSWLTDDTPSVYLPSTQRTRTEHVLGTCSTLRCACCCSGISG